MTIESRLKRLEKLAAAQGPTPAPGSVSLAEWVVAYGRLADLYRNADRGDVFDRADGDLQRLLADNRMPAGARAAIEWLLEHENSTYAGLTEAEMLAAARDIENRHGTRSQDG
jgi:hypothetical protein